LSIEEDRRRKGTFQGRFVELVPLEKIVWFVQFESQEPGLTGEMRITGSLAAAEGRTDVNVLCGGTPEGIRPGCRSSLQN
jgi:hypothetical protein